jgi:PilZ domain-containing protein
MSIVAVNRLQIKRRSARLALNAPVRLAGQDCQKCAFTLLPARATGLNRHGAAIQVGRELLVGSTLSVRHGRGGTETPARVVAQVSARQGIFTYGVEFLDSDATKDFWGIAFPSVESGDATAQVAEQSGIVRRRRGIPSHQSWPADSSPRG